MNLEEIHGFCSGLRHLIRRESWHPNLTEDRRRIGMWMPTNPDPARDVTLLRNREGLDIARPYI